MDYTLYINNLKKRLTYIEESKHFKTGTQRCKVYPPAFSDEIEEMEKKIKLESGMNNFIIWNQIKQFYLTANGLDFAWQYKDNIIKNRIIAGISHIPIIYEIFDPIDHREQSFSLLYKEFRIFDWCGKENHVAFRFTKDEPEPKLYYYMKEVNSYYLLSLNFIEYIQFLVETIGLYPWQKFFISDPNFSINRNENKSFLSDLDHLFPWIDIKRFHAKLKISG